MTNDSDFITKKAVNFELFVTIITVISWLNAIVFWTAVSPSTKTLIFWSELILTPFFLANFLLYLVKAKSRRQYLLRSYGWLDLLGSLPFLRWLRFYHVFRVSRYMRSHGGRSVFVEFFANRTETAVFTILLALILLFEFGSMAILRNEASSEFANITTAGDAVWWVLVTVATVGYGDLYPVTSSGRVVGFFVISTGVGLFGVLSGSLARAFLGNGRGKNTGTNGQIDRLSSEVESLLQELKEIRAEQAHMRQVLGSGDDTITDRLQRLESLLEKTNK